ncbi:hypothetical protein QQZ08_004396 [Neonectria magnoliae]|uniref:Uncharacterized protein n=1 Tax=Neonectria magnoliae TaxID=2732573 RepID=A0ABR1I8L5_9HYPO
MSLSKEGKRITSKVASKIVQEAIRERDETLSKLSGSTSKKDDLVGGLVRIVAAGIGFVSEASHYRREKKKKSGDEESLHQPQQPDNTPAPEQVNEAIWAIDDAGQEAATNQADSPSPKEPSNLAEAFLKRHPRQHDVDSDKRLTLPVILVQRRPKTRTRGFVPGYAPILADVGIDQETFLDFINTFNKALEPNPYLYALNLAGFVDVAFPDPMMMLLGVGIDIATDAAMEAQSRFRSNKFLDRVNEELFIPRGLVCLVVTWKPDVDDDEFITEVDFDGKATKPRPETSLVQVVREVITKKISSEEGMRSIQEQTDRMMKPYSSAFHWEEPAPLIFPALDKTGSDQNKVGDEKKKNTADRAEKWLDEYMDRRAQAKWIEKNPDVPMTSLLPKPEFRSRYADPNHPASSGDIVAFVTGRRWEHGSVKTADGESDHDKAETARDANDEMPEPTKAREKSRSSKGGTSKTQAGGLMSLFQKDVLYLVIVNLPSQELMVRDSDIEVSFLIAAVDAVTKAVFMAWCGIVAWRTIYILLFTRGTTLKEISSIAYPLPSSFNTFCFSRCRPLSFALVIIISLSFPVQYFSIPLLHGSIAWTPTQFQGEENSLQIPTTGESRAWDEYNEWDEICEGLVLRSASLGLTPSADSFHRDDGAARRAMVNYTGILVNSTIKMVKFPYFIVDKVGWIEDPAKQVPEKLIAALQDDKLGRLNISGPGNVMTRSTVGNMAVLQDYAWNPAPVLSSAPNTASESKYAFPRQEDQNATHELYVAVMVEKRG